MIEKFLTKLIEFYTLKNGRLKVFLSVLFFNMLFFLIVFLKWEPFFGMNDDMQMMFNISGIESGKPSVYGIFVSIIISFPLTVLYSILPSVPWYGVLLVSVMLFSLTTIVYNVLKTVKTKKQVVVAILAYLVFFVVFVLEYLCYIQFTTVAGLAALTAVSTVLTMNFSNKKDFVVDCVVIGVFSVLSLGIRTDTFLMVLPFLLLALIFNIFGSRLNLKKHYKQFVTVILLIAVSAGVVTGADSIVKLANKEYKEFIEYCEARSLILDYYGLPNYDEHLDFYESNGISVDTYNSIKAFALGVDDITTDTLKTIASYSRGLKFGRSLSVQFKEALTGVMNSYHYVPYGLGALTYALLLLLIFAVYLSISRKDFLGLIAYVVVIAAVFVISLFLAWYMKFPLRLSVILKWLMYLFFYHRTVALLSYQKEKNKAGNLLFEENNVDQNSFIVKNKKLAKNIIGCILCFLCLLVTVPAVQANTHYVTLVQGTRQHYSDFRETRNEYFEKNPDNFYFYDILTFSAVNVRIFSFNYNEPANCAPTGGWNAKSPAYNEKLISNGFKSMDDALTNSNVFIIVRRDYSLYFINYYESKYPDKECYIADTVPACAQTDWVDWVILGLKDKV